MIGLGASARTGCKIMLFGFVCVFAFFTHISGAAAESVGQSVLEAKLGKFGVFTKMNADGLISVKLLYGEKDISQDKDATYREVTFDELASNFPLENMETLKINLYTGGANCCQGYYLIAEGKVPHGAGHYAAYIEPYDGGHALNIEPSGYAAKDASFKGYQIEGTDVFLSRAESSRCSRLLVFENGKWRTDRIGEFPAYYRGMASESRDSGLNPIYNAIALGYYSLMEGNPPESVKQLLQKEMPKEFASKPEIVNRILADIEKAAKEFNPVKNLGISK